VSEVRAAVLVAASRIEIQTFERPVTGEDDGLLYVEANGICGTDVHWRESNHDTPRILGHEVVGRIVELGERAAARWGVAVGDRVAIESGLSCGACRDCVAGHGQNCAQGRSYGSNITTAVAPALWGGFGELMYLAPQTILTRLGPDVPADVAAGWFSPLANGVDWTGPIGGDVQPGDVVVVLGPGPQGLAACLAARARGAATIILAGLAKDDLRLKAGLTLGADAVVAVDQQSVLEVTRELSAGAMADVVVDVSGSVSSAHTAAQLVRRRGRIAAASPINATSDVALPLADMIWKQVRWQGVLSNRPSAAPAAAHLLSANIDLLRPLVTHRYDLEQADLAIDVTAGRVSDQTAIKVVVCPNGVEPEYDLPA
jgi:threonine dehydrogenase-like Zn-dependent dehydrogenase